MKTTRLFFGMCTIAVALASCNNAGKTTGNEMQDADTTIRQSEQNNPDVGSEEMKNHHATDSMGQKTTGGH